MRKHTARLGRSLLKFIKSPVPAIYYTMLSILVWKELVVFEFFLRGALRNHVILLYLVPQILSLDNQVFNSGGLFYYLGLILTSEHLSSYLFCFIRFSNIHETLVDILLAGSIAKLMLIGHSLKLNLVSKDAIIFFN